MTDQQFMKLLAHFDQRLNELYAEMQQLRRSVGGVYGVADAMYKRLDVIEIEQAMLGGQVGLHSEWIGRAAKSGDVPFDASG